MRCCFIISGSLEALPNIYLLEEFPPAAAEHCQRLFHTILPTDPEVKNWRNNATAILVREQIISAGDVFQAKNLKAIGKQGVGIDIIGQDACAKKKIPILNTPGANAQSVAELVLSLTMAVARQLRPIVVKQAANQAVRKEHCSGITLQGKTIGGIVGMGNIGLAVARIFRRAFGSPALAYDPFAPKDAWHDIENTRVDNVEEMLPHLDILTLHLPLTPKTRNFISSPQLQFMKKDAILINGSRRLDCHDEEPPTLKRYEKLWATGRLISTPHIVATTRETQVHTATTALSRVYEFLTTN
ncbi:uncharacterized protein BDV17DRAFT_278874 [Aspergillus undulatus]|uniref:uncharacterized protein n=1 Tax=Aspergillus undulatus TaxID=1810928 RepID=UPI003CCD75E2